MGSGWGSRSRTSTSVGGGRGGDDGRYLGPAAGRNRAKVPQAKARWCLQDYSETDSPTYAGCMHNCRSVNTNKCAEQSLVCPH